MNKCFQIAFVMKNKIEVIFCKLTNCRQLGLNICCSYGNSGAGVERQRIQNRLGLLPEERC